MELAFGSWSGGKDCCLACYRAITSGLKVSYLVNMVTEDGERSRSHGLAARVAANAITGYEHSAHSARGDER